MKLFYTFRRRALQHPLVRLYYLRYSVRHTVGRHRWKRGIYLVWLFFLFAVLKTDPRRRLRRPESCVRAHPSRESLLRACSRAESLCLDAELLFVRKTSDERAIRYAAGQKLGVDEYDLVRAAAAAEADRRCKGRASLREVCCVLSEWCGMSAERAEREELQSESAVCLCDPFYVSLVREVREQKKRVYIFAEGRLPSAFYEAELQKRGISCDGVYTSVECGKLWEELKGAAGKALCLCALPARKKKAQKSGMRAVFVPTLSEKFALYRPLLPPSPALSVYGGALCECLHLQERPKSPFYEYAFVGGGLLAYAFCRWLDGIVRERGIDCILFFARDAEIFYTIYKKYFSSVPCHYLHVSRAAACKVAAAQNFSVYLDRMFSCKEGKVTAKQAMREAGISQLEQKLPPDLAGEERLDAKSMGRLHGFLTERREEVLAAYAQDRQAFIKYCEPFLGGKRRALAVDLGWRGTVFSLLSQVWREAFPDLSAEGLLLGASDCPLFFDLFASGRAEGFVGARSLCGEEDKLLLAELLFSSPGASTSGYAFDGEGNPVPVFFERENAGEPALRDFRAGIEDFCSMFRDTENRLGVSVRISGEEAAAAYALAADSRYALSLFGRFRASPDPNGSPVRVRALLGGGRRSVQDGGDIK